MNASELVSYLHPYERRVLPFLATVHSVEDLAKETKLQEVEVIRALQWLENKGVIILETRECEEFALAPKAQAYLTKGLPETQFLRLLEKQSLSFSELQKKISKEEFNVSLGMLKREGAIHVENAQVSITDKGKKILLEPNALEETLKKIHEGKPLSAQDEKNVNILVKRGLVKVTKRHLKRARLTPLGKELLKQDLKISEELVERLTPEMLKSGSWEGKTFRKYDITINVPKITRGKRHFVNEAIDYARKVWLTMGFQEMTGTMVNTSYWNFDALFTAQDHPVREMQDTFFLADPAKGTLPKNYEKVKEVHENGGNTQSKGWGYTWKEHDAQTNVLRTHTTVLSAQTLAKLKQEDLPAKFFAVGKVFRNETVDWSHLFEFNQSEGIVVDEHVNFRHLLGYLRRFFTLLGFPKARFRPAYFPYTEPSVEIDVFHPVHKKWVELGGAGIFRPEVTTPLLGKEIPVLAWGPGFDRIMTDYYEITDLRDLYKNDLKQLREIKSWMR
ncbi:phenylalanine--tRNA ligase subunit alpha [Candidatus Woesearchaeota archaeon]|nr:MAG: phenylalanine--tRNA ligase subunit alpha [Candidatus Woesearchaeota archaeon]